MKNLALVCCLVTLGGCTTIGGQPLALPKTPGEAATSYGYVPLDPLSISTSKLADSCMEPTTERVPLLEALPDLAIRFAVAKFDGSGGLTFGPSKTTVAKGSYRAVLDYVNVDAVPVDFLVRKYVMWTSDGKHASAGGAWVPVSAPLDDARIVTTFDARLIDSRNEKSALTDEEARSFERVTIPVYVGVGLRLSADVTALKGGITLSGLGIIGAQAEADNLTGTLTVQTLGVNGKSIAVGLPLPNKLDQTTIESGILAIGSSRAMLYTAGAPGEQVTATPRVVGLYSPIGSDPRLINAVYSELSRERPQWPWPCRLKKS